MKGAALFGCHGQPLLGIAREPRYLVDMTQWLHDGRFRLELFLTIGLDGC